MGRYAEEQWYIDHVSTMIVKHGDFPPPWIYSENSHPCCIEWRWGDGEMHIMAFGEWWEQQDKSFEERIDYFRTWPAPPRWCGWMADVIWDIDPCASEGDECNYAMYFEQLKNLGFKGTDDYESDLNDEKWM